MGFPAAITLCGRLAEFFKRAHGSRDKGRRPWWPDHPPWPRAGQRLRCRPRCLVAMSLEKPMPRPTPRDRASQDTALCDSSAMPPARKSFISMAPLAVSMMPSAQVYQTDGVGAENAHRPGSLAHLRLQALPFCAGFAEAAGENDGCLRACRRQLANGLDHPVCPTSTRPRSGASGRVRASA